jgi:HD-like signal output (HDOD) protein
MPATMTPQAASDASAPNSALTGSATRAGPAPMRPTAASRSFGRFALRALLGKSQRTMTWLAFDPVAGHEVMLCMPRVAPAGATALDRWLLDAKRAARLDHPNLARVTEVGIQENWPFVSVDRAIGVTLDEWLAQHPAPSPEESAGWCCEALRGLAFAHEAGISHADPQMHTWLINERGQLCMMALAVAGVAHGADQAHGRRTSPGMPLDPAELRARRRLAEQDLLACGILLHGLLAQKPALGSADTALVIERMSPLGRELVRLPWTTPIPVPGALRVIVDRSTSGQVRLRYRGARTFLSALGGWRDALSSDDGGPMALLLDRLRTVGHLPALPGLAARVQRVLGLESQRTDDIANDLLPDLALSFELLRTLHTAQVQGTQIAGNGPVLTLRRVVALIGVNGVRLAANSLRVWPGPLDEAGASALRGLFDRVRLAGHMAQALRPAGYDAEVVYLIAVLQNLGRLLARYHFADESTQIDQLMQSSKEPGAGTDADQAGLSEEAAGFAVLGIDIESLGIGVGKHWELGDEVLHMIRRLPQGAPVRKPDGDVDVLRIVASAANETVDAVSQLPPARVGAALNRIAERYARVLNVDGRALQDALKEARDMVRDSSLTARAGRSRTTVEPGVHAAESGAEEEKAKA